MDFFTRIFSYLDPDLWDLPYEKANTEPINLVLLDGQILKLPNKAFEKIFNFLNIEDLKNCRLVCQKWNELIVLILPVKTCVILEGSKNDWKVFSTSLGERCEKYLKVSSRKFSLWSTLKVKKVSTTQLNYLLQQLEEQFDAAVFHITSVKFVESCLEWTTLLKFLRRFQINLKTVEFIKSSFHVSHSYMDRFYSFTLTNHQPNHLDLINFLKKQCAEEEFSYWSLKSLKIVEGDSETSSTAGTLSAFSARTGILDEVVLEIGKRSASLQYYIEQTEYWTRVHNFLSLKDVEKLKIISQRKVHSGFSKRFLLSLCLWREPPGGGYWRLAELIIFMKPIQLWSGFENQLIPFVRSLQNLKKFSIKMIVLRENKAYMLDNLAEAPPRKNCEFEFGVIIDDIGGLVAASYIKVILSTELVLKSMKALDIVIFTDAIITVHEMIPYYPSTPFLLVEQFTIATNGTVRRRFNNFNISIMVQNFPNLTELQIYDGPNVDYGSYMGVMGRFNIDKQWNLKSAAKITDDDMQLIIENLIQLKILTLRVNMKYLTDTGMTGICLRVCKEMRYSYHNSRVPYPDVNSNIQLDGYSLSNLRKLQCLDLQGVGNRVSDVTAYQAFTDLLDLKKLTIYGSFKMTEKGKDYLRKTFFKIGCKVFLN